MQRGNREIPIIGWFVSFSNEDPAGEYIKEGREIKVLVNISLFTYAAV